MLLGNDDWLEEQIRTSHGHLSFQNPDNIADDIRLISGVSLWNEVCCSTGRLQPQDMLENSLRLIVNRRNQIAHEADLNPSYPGVLWPIDLNMADSAVTFIENLAEAIHAVVA